VISVVMPAHNEQDYLEDAVERVVDGLVARRLPFEVIISENGSTDATADVAAKLAASHDEVTFSRSARADYGRALRAGFLAAQGDIVVNFDVDLVDLDFLERALAVMDARPELAAVVGSKRSPGAADRRSLGRQAITAVFSLVLRVGFGLRVSDTHGLKALRRLPLEPLVAACQFGADIFDTELILRAERAGLAVTDVPVTVADQRPPRTPILRRIPRSLAGLARLRLALWRNQPSPAGADLGRGQDRECGPSAEN
jgi:glycosyltransferase involved in cell wall biosynthesis